jgi:hypothetical protein
VIVNMHGRTTIRKQNTLFHLIFSALLPFFSRIILNLRKHFIFYILVTVHLGIILINNLLEAQFLLYIFISILYMFRADCAHHQESQLYQYNI